MPEIRTYKVKYLLGTTGNTEWWTDKDWKEHTRYVERLKASGDYLKETETTISLVHNPIFDTPLSIPLESCKLIFLDFGKVDRP